MTAAADVDAGTARGIRNQPLLRQAAALNVGTLVGAACSFGVAIAAVRVLGAARFGDVVLFLAVPQLTLGLLQTRSGAVVMRHVAFSVSSSDEDGVHPSSFMRAGTLCDVVPAVLAGVASILVWLVATPSFSEEVHNGVSLLAVYGVSIAVRAAHVTARAALVAVGQTSFAARTDIASSLVNTVIVVTMLLVDETFDAFVIGSSIGNIVGYGGAAVVGLARARRVVRDHTGIVSVRRAWQRMRRGIVATFSASTITAVLLSGDVLLLSRWLNSEEIGMYRLALRGADLPIMVASGLATTTTATLARRAAESSPLLSTGAPHPSSIPVVLRAAVRATHDARRVTIGVSLGCMLAVPAVLVLAVSGDRSLAVAALLFTGAQALWLIGFALRPVFIVLQREWLFLGSVVASVLVSLPLVPYLSSRHGLVGAGVWWGTWNLLQLCIVAATIGRWRRRYATT